MVLVVTSRNRGRPCADSTTPIRRGRRGVRLKHCSGPRQLYPRCCGCAARFWSFFVRGPVPARRQARDGERHGTARSVTCSLARITLAVPSGSLTGGTSEHAQRTGPARAAAGPAARDVNRHGPLPDRARGNFAVRFRHHIHPRPERARRGRHPDPDRCYRLGACALATWCPPVASSVAIPRRSRSGRRRSPAEGRRRAPMAQAGRRHGTSGGGHARTATSARSPWCSAAVRWETVSTPGQPLRARAACTPRSSDAAARPHIPPLSGRGRARERAAHTSAAPAPRPAQAILFPPPAESLRRPLSPETGRCSARSQCRSSS